MRVNADAISVHQVKGVQFDADDFDDTRHRIEKREWKFAANSRAAEDLPDF